MTESMRGAAWWALFVAASIVPAMVFAAGDEETAATESAAAGEGFNYEQAFGTYHWVTPAAFTQATGETVGSFTEAP